jgi:hypothetical protein
MKNRRVKILMEEFVARMEYVLSFAARLKF